MISILLYGLVGLLAGVFLNRAADNLPPPRSLSLLAAPRCASCGRERELWEQSGLVAFILTRGTCPNCGAPLHLRAPVVEFVTAWLFAFLYARLGPGLPLFTYCLFTALLLLITVIDLEHRLILNVVVLPTTLLALLLNPLTPLGVSTSAEAHFSSQLSFTALGAAIGYVSVFGIYLLGALFTFVMSRRRGWAIDEVAFGMGDVKLAGLAGALVAFPTIFSVLLYTVLLGGVVSVLVLLFQLLVRRRYSVFMAIPYGPFFTITTWIFMAAGAGLLQGVW